MKIYNWNDILIIGDSFATERSEETDWPQLVCCTLTNSKFDPERLPRGKGFKGASWWSVRKELITQLELSMPKVLILCHTDAMRIPSDKDMPANYHTCKFLASKNKHRSPEWNAAVQYFEHLISFDFHKWAQYRWFTNVDEILENYDIPIILHLYVNDKTTFLYNELIYEFKKGVTINQCLLKYASEILNPKLMDSLRNHYTTLENIEMSNRILGVINDSNEYYNGTRDF